MYSQEAINATVPDVTKYRFIADSNKDRLSNVSMNYFDNKISYRTFFNEVKKVASALKRYGVNAKDIVSIISLNTPETAYVIYTLNYLGAVANLLVATSSKNEVTENIRNTKSKMVFVLDKILEKYDGLEVGVPIVVLPMAESAKGLVGFLMKHTQKKLSQYVSYKFFVSKQATKIVLKDLPMNSSQKIDYRKLESMINL